MSDSATYTIDPARIAFIVRQVIARIQNQTTQDTPAEVAATVISDNVITVATIDALSGCPSQISVGAKAVITPAARDEAKERGITIVRGIEPTKKPASAESTSAQPIPTTDQDATQQEVVDIANPERATLLLAQLSRRGVHAIGSTIVLSETPATDVFRYCNSENERAVMLTSISDIARFADELRPTVWVLDMKRMNLMSAVNAASQIAQKS